MSAPISLRVPAFVLCFGMLNACGEAPAPDTGAVPDRAPRATARDAELTRELLLIDTHIDVPYRLHEGFVDVGKATDGGDFDYPRAREGGLDALFMSIYIPADVDAAGEGRALAEDLIDTVEGLAVNAPEKFAVATCVQDIHALKQAGIIALPLGMENGGPIAGDFESLRHFRNRGIRYITLAHSKSNHISDSSYDPEERWQGLSEFGKSLIPEMNRQGVMVDVSHISDRAFWQVLELSKTPVIASHSSLRHFTPGFQRNMSDEMVSALGAAGGVVQINFGSGFLTAAARQYAEDAQQALKDFQAEEHAGEEADIAAFMQRYAADNPYPFASVDDVLDHIDRVVMLAGIEHVGIGSDYDGVGNTLPEGLKDVAQYPNLIAGLRHRGYSDEDIGRILGGNLLRVWSEVESFATQEGNPPLCAISA